MVMVVVFRSRLNADAMAEYEPWAERMSALAATMPGHISHKTFAAADGERVTIVEFDTEAHMRAWALHPDHLQAQQLGRSRFYSEFRLQVCEQLRESGQGVSI